MAAQRRAVAAAAIPAKGAVGPTRPRSERRDGRRGEPPSSGRGGGERSEGRTGDGGSGEAEVAGARKPTKFGKFARRKQNLPDPRREKRRKCAIPGRQGRFGIGLESVRREPLRPRRGGVGRAGRKRAPAEVDEVERLARPAASTLSAFGPARAVGPACGADGRSGMTGMTGMSGMTWTRNRGGCPAHQPTRAGGRVSRADGRIKEPRRAAGRADSRNIAETMGCRKMAGRRRPAGTVSATAAVERTLDHQQ